MRCRRQSGPSRCIQVSQTGKLTYICQDPIDFVSFIQSSGPVSCSTTWKVPQSP
jgi:hypothetical protein